MLFTKNKTEKLMNWIGKQKFKKAINFLKKNGRYICFKTFGCDDKMRTETYEYNGKRYIVTYHSVMGNKVECA